MTTDMIECPFCAELIKAKAKKCRYCDELLEIGLTDEAVLIEFEKRKQTTDVKSEGAPVAAAEAKAPEQVVKAEAPPVPPQEDSVEAQAPVVVASDEGDAETAADPLDELYQKLAQMPDSPERELVIQTLQQLAIETQKGEEAEESKVEDMIKTVVKVLPDVAEITINTIINPASGLLTLVQKVVQRAAKSQEKKATEEETQEPQISNAEDSPPQAQAAATPVKVDAEEAAEALSKVHEQLEEMPDSPEKELVEQTLQQLEDESPKDEKAGESKVEELISSVAEVLPDLAEAAIKTVQQVAESTDESQ